MYEIKLRLEILIKGNKNLFIHYFFFASIERDRIFEINQHLWQVIPLQLAVLIKKSKDSQAKNHKIKGR